jgi:hypothetical protein
MKNSIGLGLLISLSIAGSLSSPAAATVEISSKNTKNMSCASGICSPTAKKAVLNVNDLAGMLASGNVIVKSDRRSQDVEIDAPLSWTAKTGLTLRSYRSIVFNKQVEIAGNGGLDLVTNAGGSNGDFHFFKGSYVKFWDLKSHLTINGAKYRLERSISRLASDIRNNPTGLYALTQSVDLSGHNYSKPPIAGLAGSFEGLGNTISNLTINDVTPGDDVGFFGELTSVESTVRDLGLVSVNINAGGIATGYVGAIAGFLSAGAAVRNCYAKGQISGGANTFVGGLVGYSFANTIDNSFAAVDLAGRDGATALGGLVGYIEDGCPPCVGISRSYASGSVSGENGVFLGGLVGESVGGIILNSYASGSASVGDSSFVGGLIGSHSDSHDGGSGSIENSYSTGLVTSGSNSLAGGLLGEDLTEQEITNSYWDLDTSGISNPSQGAGNIPDDPGITGLSDAQLKSGLPAGFDPKIWAINPKINNGYPYLIDNPPRD